MPRAERAKKTKQKYHSACRIYYDHQEQTSSQKNYVIWVCFIVALIFNTLLPSSLLNIVTIKIFLN